MPDSLPWDQDLHTLPVPDFLPMPGVLHLLRFLLHLLQGYNLHLLPGCSLLFLLFQHGHKLFEIAFRNILPFEILVIDTGVSSLYCARSIRALRPYLPFVDSFKFSPSFIQLIIPSIVLGFSLVGYHSYFVLSRLFPK